MARKVRMPVKPAPRSQQADAMFTQLLITAMRIYGDSVINKGKTFRTR
jgi:hypothetical protein